MKTNFKSYCLILYFALSLDHYTTNIVLELKIQNKNLRRNHIHKNKGEN